MVAERASPLTRIPAEVEAWCSRNGLPHLVVDGVIESATIAYVDGDSFAECQVFLQTAKAAGGSLVAVRIERLDSDDLAGVAAEQSVIDMLKPHVGELGCVYVIAMLPPIGTVLRWQ